MRAAGGIDGVYIVCRLCACSEEDLWVDMQPHACDAHSHSCQSQWGWEATSLAGSPEKHTPLNTRVCQRDGVEKERLHRVVGAAEADAAQRD